MSAQFSEKYPNSGGNSRNVNARRVCSGFCRRTNKHKSNQTVGRVCAEVAAEHAGCCRFRNFGNFPLFIMQARAASGFEIFGTSRAGTHFDLHAGPLLVMVYLDETASDYRLGAFGAVNVILRVSSYSKSQCLPWATRLHRYFGRLGM